MRVDNDLNLESFTGNQAFYPHYRREICFFFATHPAKKLMLDHHPKYGLLKNMKPLIMKNEIVQALPSKHQEALSLTIIIHQPNSRQNLRQVMQLVNAKQQQYT